MVFCCGNVRRGDYSYEIDKQAQAEAKWRLEVEKLDSESSLWKLVETDQLSWDEYERRVGDVIRQQMAAEHRAELAKAPLRPQPDKLTKHSKKEALLMLVMDFLLIAVILTGIYWCADAIVTANAGAQTQSQYRKQVEFRIWEEQKRTAVLKTMIEQQMQRKSP